LIAVELDGVENNVEDFKTSNELTDINSEAKLYIEGSNEYDKRDRGRNSVECGVLDVKL
jgi:hypothetical protein